MQSWPRESWLGTSSQNSLSSFQMVVARCHARNSPHPGMFGKVRESLCHGEGTVYRSYIILLRSREWLKTWINHHCCPAAPNPSWLYFSLRVPNDKSILWKYLGMVGAGAHRYAIPTHCSLLTRSFLGQFYLWYLTAFTEHTFDGKCELPAVYL